MEIKVEYFEKDGFSAFLSRVKTKKIALLYDINTAPFAEKMRERLTFQNCEVLEVAFPDEELVPTEDRCEKAQKAADRADYVLAVGSGTLNDMAKSVATKANIPSGVLATAASMDGYCSAGSALMRNGFKVTDVVNPPSDVLLDASVICTAPREMTAAGFGDIVGKYTCLADWKLANIINGEPIDTEAFEMMEKARELCLSAYGGLTENEGKSVKILMEALVTAGLSMAKCGNSRPASGSEHHQSHFLEMDFVRRGEKIPPHGVKVAIGTLVSLELYHNLSEKRIKCPKSEKVWALADTLPSVKEVEKLLSGMGCPTRFSQIGVSRETMAEMLKKAHTVRDRYTVLTLYAQMGLMDEMLPMLLEKFY